MPFVRPVNTKLVVAEPTFRTLLPITPVATDTPSDAKTLTWYSVIKAPPFEAGAVQLMVL